MVKDPLKPYSCQLCDSTFGSKSYLQRHQTVHSEERHFHCLICAKSYKYRKGLNRHIKKLHTTLDYSDCFYASEPSRSVHSLPKQSALHPESDFKHGLYQVVHSSSEPQDFKIYSTCPYPYSTEL